MIKLIHAHRTPGVTLVELLIAVTILSMLVVGVSPFISLTQRGFSSMEAHNSLKTGGQEAINRIGNKLAQCKRLFENTVDSDAFRARAVLTTQPTIITGSKIPIIEENGTLSPGATGFISASMGNSIFFASIEAPADMDVLDSTGNPCVVRIDYYQFNYFYLAEEALISLAGQPRINLWEWHSEKYADYTQLINITDTTKRQNAVKVLFASGTTCAWDPSVTSINLAFYTLDAAGALTLNPAHTIAEDSAKPMIKLITGVTAGSYRYGISPNTGITINSSHPVPQYATTSGKYPSGLEVIVIGPNSARQIFIRLVHLAQGSFKGYISSEQILLTTARDLW
jgi:prepilin-type N-terminal cleavage/methylation domain-containing protein